jgi:hypothetical protein
VAAAVPAGVVAIAPAAAGPEGRALAAAAVVAVAAPPRVAAEPGRSFPAAERVAAAAPAGEMGSAAELVAAALVRESAAS